MNSPTLSQTGSPAEACTAMRGPRLVQAGESPVTPVTGSPPWIGRFRLYLDQYLDTVPLVLTAGFFAGTICGALAVASVWTGFVAGAVGMAFLLGVGCALSSWEA